MQTRTRKNSLYVYSMKCRLGQMQTAFNLLTLYFLNFHFSRVSFSFLDSVSTMVCRAMSMALLVKVMVLSLTTRVAAGQEEIMSEMDLIASLGKDMDSGGEDTPRLVKVITRDSEGQFPVEEGWQLVDDDNTLLYDQHFLDHFLHDQEMVQEFHDGNLAFVEGRNIS